ncbi:hypothetical protein, partial [Humibacter sp.]|uniref:hypothetical protein n=1 Tax=Humibacter sp. TaxID=1940291 RepID=UPI002C2ACB5E
MPKRQVDDDETRVDASYVERKLGISRSTRLRLEDDGVLNPVRLTPSSHRRYTKAEVDALAKGQVS